MSAARAAPAAADRLPLPHLGLATLVIAVWGTNFVVIDAALHAFSPFTLAALRFLLSVFPWILFVRRPPLAWRWMAAYGAFTALQYGLLYLAMGRDIAPGLASVVLQAQVFFTIAIALVSGRERLRPSQALAIGLGAAGLLLIALRAGGAATPLGLILTLGAALSWALANTVTRRAAGGGAVAFIVWGSVFTSLPLCLAALTLEGWPAIAADLRHADAGAWGAVLWQAIANNILGFGAWAWLLARHPAATVAPTALMVPLFGLGAAALALGEPLPAWKLCATALILAGLALNLLAPSLPPGDRP
jgi:O-acetylserine/cysteine efflux transporter